LQEYCMCVLDNTVMKYLRQSRGREKSLCFGLSLETENSWLWSRDQGG